MIDSVAFDPVRLCGGPVEVGGVHFVSYGGDDAEHGESCLGQGVEQMVAAVAGLVDTDIVATEVGECDAPPRAS